MHISASTFLASYKGAVWDELKKNISTIFNAQLALFWRKLGADLMHFLVWSKAPFFQKSSINKVNELSRT